MGRTFKKVVEQRLAAIADVLESKAAEYSQETNRFHNFTRAGQITNQHPVAVLRGYWLKHLTSVMDIIEKLERGESVDRKLFEEKVGDSINYQILLEGLAEHLDLIDDVKQN